MTFLESVRARASASPRRLLFPEASDARVRAAVTALAAGGIVEPVLVSDDVRGGDMAAIRVLVLDPARDPRRVAVAALLRARCEAKGRRGDDAGALARDPLCFADALVALGEADGCVAGAVYRTADVVRAALATVGPAPGVHIVSSAFYMVVPPAAPGCEERVLTFADCAVVPHPSPDELAEIALSAAADRRRIVGDVPRVAFLSYSTHGSAEGPSVTAVRSAVAIVRERAPGLAVDGELQGDAALDSVVAARKAPGSAVAGAANVLVFPSLDAGNIAYKLVQRLARAEAVGPIVQGLARPCSDLSRGASMDDIINVAAITALQASALAGTPMAGSRPETES